MRIRLQQRSQTGVIFIRLGAQQGVHGLVGGVKVFLVYESAVFIHLPLDAFHLNVKIGGMASYKVNASPRAKEHPIMYTIKNMINRFIRPSSPLWMRIQKSRLVFGKNRTSL